jgi:hypothetical protein
MSAAPIRTEHVYPPIPIRDFDWSAARDGYEPGAPIGYGRTEAEAIAALLEKEDERNDGGCPHGAVDAIFCTPCMDAQAVRIGAELAKDREYIKRDTLRRVASLARMPFAIDPRRDND